MPDLDTSLAINGFKSLAACHTGQDGRQSAHPAASLIAAGSLPVLPLQLLFPVNRAQYGQSRAAVIITV